jgi:hypothetical protein
MFRKVAAVAVGTSALLVGLALPAQAAQSSSAACMEGSRSITATNAEEMQTVYADGTKGRAQITLRRSGSCWWGLLEGRGVIWLERVVWHNKDYMNPDFYLYSRTNKENGVTHTAATVTTAHSVPCVWS